MVVLLNFLSFLKKDKNDFEINFSQFAKPMEFNGPFLK